MFKINWDSASDKDKRNIGLGAIIRDSKGMVIGTFRITKPLIDCPFIAKALALNASQFCKDIGITHLITEEDALQVINTLEMLYK